jgi:SAM-dependent methyltransferase
MAQYNHTEAMHNLVAPKIIVPKVMELLNVNSVVDIGCGLGTFLRVFKEEGVKNVLGLDGPWCKKDLLFKNINQEEFLEVNMEDRIVIPRTFDLAVCLEVAEHLSPKRAASFAEDLTKLSDTILFSAAIPSQGGDHHYNEQWLSYWSTHFSTYGYQVFDVLKPYFWNNPQIFFWYKQNMVLFIKKGSEPEKVKSLIKNNLENIVHPELFNLHTNYKDKNAIKRGLRFLYKALIHKIGILN